MRRWFHLRQGRWVVDEAVRALVRFTSANLLDARGLGGVGRADAVFCRNVMIYFELAARRRALKALHERLRPGGWLLLGHSESLLNVSADFELVHLKGDLVYRKPGEPGEVR
jgi:chemotaxis protein methyltransferase CheR